MPVRAASPHRFGRAAADRGKVGEHAVAGEADERGGGPELRAPFLGVRAPGTLPGTGAPRACEAETTAVVKHPADVREDGESRRDGRLVQVTAAIAQAVTPAEVLAAVVDEVALAVNASSAGLFMLDEVDQTVRLVRSVGYPAESRRRLAAVPLDSALRSPALDAIANGESVSIASQEELLARYPNLAPLVTKGRSYATCCLPLMAQSHTIGCLGLTFEGGHLEEHAQRGLLALLARYAGQALERLRLLEAEKKSREAAEAAADRMALLGRVGAAASSPRSELTEVLDEVAGELTRGYCHVAVIGLFPPDGDALEVAAVQHRDPQATELARDVLQVVGGGVSGSVARDGRSVLIAEIDDAELFARSQPLHRRWLEAHTPRSLVAVALRARGQILGVLSVQREDGAPSFDMDDLRFVEELGERVAFAVERSRLDQARLRALLRAQLMYRLVREVMGASRVEDVFDAALDAVEQALGARRSSILVVDRDGVLRFKAWRHISDTYRDTVEGHSPWVLDVHAPEPVTIADAESDPAMAGFRELLRSEGIGALAFFPLVAGGRLIGKFMAYYERPHQLSADDLDTATAIANHVAAALARFAAVAELEETVRFNEMFTAVLGHDLRNPLAAIMTAAQLAIRRGESERLVKPLARILTSGDRMARMIDQLLDFARARVGGGIPIERHRVDLAVLMRQAMDEVAYAHPNWSLKLERVGDAEGEWDADRLLQVFSNLVANAVQHGELDYGVTVRVDGTDGSKVCVTIHNSGVIPEDVLPKLFEPMSGGTRRRDGSRGLGLGLFITYEVLRAHGGSVTVRSMPDEGTTFSLALSRRLTQGEGNKTPDEDSDRR